VQVVAARFTPHGEVLRVFERQCVGSGTDVDLGSLNDVSWIEPLSYVVEILAQLLRPQVLGDVDLVRLFHLALDL